MPELIPAAVLGVLLLVREWQTSQERERLLDRIQAPEKAQIPSSEPRNDSVRFGDDEDYWDAVRERETMNGGS